MTTLAWKSNASMEVKLASFVESLSLVLLTSLYNDAAAAAGAKMVKKFASKPIAVERVVEILGKSADPFQISVEWPDGHKAPASVSIAPIGVNPETGEKVSTRERLDEDQVIVVLADANPHRAESKVGQRFSAMKSGVTIADYVESLAGVPGQRGRLDKKLARRARRAIHKEVARGAIELVTRAEWTKRAAK